MAVITLLGKHRKGQTSFVVCFLSSCSTVILVRIAAKPERKTVKWVTPYGNEAPTAICLSSWLLRQAYPKHLKTLHVCFTSSFAFLPTAGETVFITCTQNVGLFWFILAQVWGYSLYVSESSIHIANPDEVPACVIAWASCIFESAGKQQVRKVLLVMFSCSILPLPLLSCQNTAVVRIIYPLKRLPVCCTT